LSDAGIACVEKLSDECYKRDVRTIAHLLSHCLTAGKGSGARLLKSSMQTEPVYPIRQLAKRHHPSRSTPLHRAARRALFQEPRPASPEEIAPVFGPYRIPGTAPIGLRRSRPDLFQDTLASLCESWDEWLARIVQQTVRRLSPGAGPPSIGSIVHRVSRLLETPVDGHPLHGQIPQQIYEDFFTRAVSNRLPLEGTPAGRHHYSVFNRLCRRLGRVILKEIEDWGPVDRRDGDLGRLFRIAVLSGHVGINLKSTASAASALLNRDRIPIPGAWIRSLEAVASLSDGALAEIAARLSSLAESEAGQFAIDCLDAYRQEVADTPDPTLLVFLADDYLESMIDMQRFAILTRRNPRLNVLLVPRNGRYGNDLAWEDMAALMREPGLSGFQAMRAAGRITVSPDGPRAGCIDPRDVSLSLIREIRERGMDRRIILETKGCRNFEMLRGRLPIPWYASFNCNRALSIRTVGVDGPPVFLRIPPGLYAYDGFTRPRIAESPSYRTCGVRFCRMTTRQLLSACRTPAYRGIVSRNGGELAAGVLLSEKARGMDITVAELIEILGQDAGPAPAIQCACGAAHPE